MQLLPFFSLLLQRARCSRKVLESCYRCPRCSRDQRCSSTLEPFVSLQKAKLIPALGSLLLMFHLPSSSFSWSVSLFIRSQVKYLFSQEHSCLPSEVVSFLPCLLLIEVILFVCLLTLFCLYLSNVGSIRESSLNLPFITMALLLTSGQQQVFNHDFLGEWVTSIRTVRPTGHNTYLILTSKAVAPYPLWPLLLRW